jgi:DtxR family Mn-dependent transcriptional regulator
MMSNSCKPEKHFYSTNLTSNMEDYIETISILSEKNKVVRVKDIASELDIKMPSVTAALQKLKEQGLIHYEKYGYIELTSNGKILAQKVYDKHKLIANFLEHILFLNKNHSSEEACKLEHHMSPDTCTQLFKILDFFTNAEKENQEWYSKYRDVMRQRLLINFTTGDEVTIIETLDDTNLPGDLKVGSNIQIIEIDNTNSMLIIENNSINYTFTFNQASAVYAILV